MKMNKNAVIHTGLFSVVFLGNAVLANDIGGSVSLGTGYSDNATKSELDPLNERQDNYHASLNADYQNQTVTAGVNYQLSKRVFAENSQPDKSYLDGESSLLIGAERAVANILFSHSQRTLIANPNQLDYTSNLDERSILAVAPSVRANLNSTNSIVLTGNYSDISFKDSELRNSTRKSGNLLMNHAMSKLSELSVVADYSAVDFDHFPSVNYKLVKALLGYSAHLSRLRYSLGLGYNQSKSDTKSDFGSPSYDGSLSYTTSLNNVSLAFNKAITDSSFGNGNHDQVSQDTESDTSTQVDQIDRSYLQFSWKTSSICGRCDFGINLKTTRDKYIGISEMSNMRGGGIHFGYRLSRPLFVRASYNISKTDYQLNIFGKDFSNKSALVSINYAFSQGIDLDVIGRRQKRDSASGGQSYAENYYGVNISVNF